MNTHTETAGRKAIHANVPGAVRRELAALAQRNDRSIAAEVRRAIEAHVERERAGAAA